MPKRFTKEEYPKPFGMCVVGGYELHLYCANDKHPYGEGELQTGGNNKFEAFNGARKMGWIISEPKDIAICPYCVKEKNV